MQVTTLRKIKQVTDADAEMLLKNGQNFVDLTDDSLFVFKRLGIQRIEQVEDNNVEIYFLHFGKPFLADVTVISDEDATSRTVVFYEVDGAFLHYVKEFGDWLKRGDEENGWYPFRDVMFALAEGVFAL